MAEETKTEPKAETPAKAAKPKQQRLPGMTPPQIKRLQDKAEEVKDFEQDRLEAQQQETKARAELLAIMKELKLKHYQLANDLEVVVEATEEKAFVRKIKRKKVKARAAD